MAEFACLIGFGGVWGTLQFGDCEGVTLLEKPGIEIFRRVNTGDQAPTGNPNRFMELFGNEFIPMQYYEPDPITFRDDFYYNTRSNVLYKKVNTSTIPFWKAIGR